MGRSGRDRAGTGVWAAVLLVVVAALLPVVARSGASASVPRADRAFTDVPPTHPFFTEIEWLTGEGITTGYSDGTFRPAQSIARQAMATWLYRFEGQPAFTPPTTPTFPDVPVTHTFFTEIEWATDEGLMLGFADGSFKPTRSITRQAMAALLYRLAGEPPFTPPGSPTFTDVATTHPFFAEIEWAAANGVVAGFSDGRFKPSTAVTRQAAAAFLYRFDHLVSPRRWSPPRQVSHAEISTLLSDPVSAAGPDGSVHVAWKEDDQLLYRKLDAEGNTVVRTVHLGVTPVQARAYAQSDLAIAPLDDGGAVLFWRYSVGTPQHPGIYGVNIDAAGRVASPTTLLRAGFYSYLAAATDDAGTIHLVALENQTSTTVVSSTFASHRLVATSLAPDLQAAGPWLLVTDRIANNATNYPEIAVEGDGTVHLAWFDSRRFGSSSSTYDIYYTRYGGPGPFIAPFHLSDKATGYVVTPDLKGLEVGPAIDIAPDGTAQVAWLNLDDLHLATVAPDGSPVLRDLTTNLEDPTAKRNDGLAIHAEDDGDATIVVSSGSDDFPGLVQVRIAPEGGIVAAPTQIPVGTGGWTYPSLTEAGGELQLVVRRGSTSHRLHVLTTADDAPIDRPDLLVDDAHSVDTSAHTPARETDTVHLSVEATNAGWVASTATTAEVRYDGDLVASVPVPALAVEGVAAVEADWAVPAGIAVDPALLAVTIDPAHTVAETTETNNAGQHRVPIQLGPLDDDGLPRPAGARVVVMAWDETTDAPRTRVVGASGAIATLIGTTTEGDPFTTTGSADEGYNQIQFHDLVPPGNYVLTGSADGYQLSEPVDVTVTRDLVDPDILTVTPSPLLDLWLNRWGTITGTVTTGGGTPVVGATVVEASQGFETTTDSNGRFSLDDVAAGDHTISVTADGLTRLVDVPVAVTVNGTTDVPLDMDPVTVGYVDAVATNAYDAALEGATVELLNGANTVVSTCTTGWDGRCAFEPTAGTGYKVRTSLGGYTPTTSAPFDVVAGRSYPQHAALDIIISDLTTAGTGDQGWFVGAQQVCGGYVVPYFNYCTGAEFTNLYGFFGAQFDIEHQTVGANTVVRSLSVAVTGAPLEFTVFQAGIDVAGPIDVPLVIPDVSEEYTNARVDEIRIRDRETGEVVRTIDTTMYSHAGTSSATWLPDATVSSWSNLVIEVDLKLGKVVFGSSGSDGFEPSPILNFWGSSRRITWIPSTGQQRNDAIFG